MMILMILNFKRRLKPKSSFYLFILIKSKKKRGHAHDARHTLPHFTHTYRTRKGNLKKKKE